MNITIVMYHYVRPIHNSPYPGIKGLELSKFISQLEYIGEKYNVISAANLVKASKGDFDLPENPILLTFDDGYIDHFKYVLPELLKCKFTGLFFPPKVAVCQRKVLDVNKIHFILEACHVKQQLIEDIEDEIRTGSSSNFKTIEKYRKEFYKPNRYDNSDINYIKRMLQTGLPAATRETIIEKLFTKYVSKDETEFADNLYVSESNLKEMLDCGMEIGSHGDMHPWLNKITKKQQYKDIYNSIDMLTRIGVSKKELYFCYPYGGYNQDSINILKDLGFSAAFTTKPSVYNFNESSIFEIPRYDTNDIPLN